MKRIAGLFGLIMLLSISSGLWNCADKYIADPADIDSDTAVYGLPQGWTHDVIYANNVASPISMADADSNIYLLDRGKKAVLQINTDGSFSKYADIGDLQLDNIAYRSSDKCLLGNVGTDVYTITPRAVTKIGVFSDNKGASSFIIDPRDNSIFAVDWVSTGSINHYDSSFQFIEVIANTNYCLNMALDTQRNVLYYAETPPKTVTSLDLSTKQATIIRTNIGNGSGQENVGVTLGENGIVYYSAVWNGLFSYDPNTAQEIKIMDIPGDVGVGRIYWWSSSRTVLMTTALAGVIVKMDPTQSAAELMEPNVNTDAIVACKDGKIFFCQTEQLYAVENNTLTKIGTKGDRGDLALDDDDNLYMGLYGQIVGVNTESGIRTPLVTFNGSHNILRMEYDPINKEMVVLTEFNAKEYFYIWRTSLTQGSTPYSLVAILNPLPGSTHPCDQYIDITVDRTTGTVYVLNKTEETISTLNKSQGLSIIISNQDILTAEMPNLVGFNYFSPLQGFILTYLEERLFMPLAGSPISGFNKIACGMDTQIGYEDANGHFIGTHSGYIYRIRPIN